MAYVSQYPVAYNTTYVKDTSHLNVHFEAFFATNPANSVTGTWDDNAFIAGSVTNQRVHIDLGSAITIVRIYYENNNYIGAFTSSGAKNFIFQGSNSGSSFADLTYATDTGWTTLAKSQDFFDQHIAANTADPKYITVTNLTAYRYYAIKIADNWGDATLCGFRRIVLQLDDTPAVTSGPATNWNKNSIRLGLGV